MMDEENKEFYAEWQRKKNIEIKKKFGVKENFKEDQKAYKKYLKEKNKQDKKTVKQKSKKPQKSTVDLTIADYESMNYMKKAGVKHKGTKVIVPLFYSSKRLCKKLVLKRYNIWTHPKKDKDDVIENLIRSAEQLYYYTKTKYKEDTKGYIKGMYYYCKSRYLMAIMEYQYIDRMVPDYAIISIKNSKYGKKYIQDLNNIEYTIKKIKEHSEEWKIHRLVKYIIQGLPYLHLADEEPEIDYDDDYSYSSSDYSSSSSSYDNSSESSTCSSYDSSSYSDPAMQRTDLTDGYGRVTGYVDSQGRMIDEHADVVGHLDGDQIYDSDWHHVGEMDEDGHITYF